MILNAKCNCGNEVKNFKTIGNSQGFFVYDGALGYEAIVCVNCGKYYDITGENPADEWSKQFIKGVKS
jgi:hypothetical protein